MISRSGFFRILNTNSAFVIKYCRPVSYLSQMFPSTNNRHQDQQHKTKYLGILTAAIGVAGYVAFKEKLFALSINDELKGRRDKYNFISDVVAVSAPSVVYILIQDRYKRFLNAGQPLTFSNGSGFIIKEDGLIITNAHVVTNVPGAIIKVRLMDGTEYTGKIEDIDMDSDLATLSIPAKGLPTMKLGTSANIKPGEWVVAIGSPMTLSNTVTAGVISSTARSSVDLGLRDKNMVYIQTDAPITFGNSGGPLVNLDGEAIGVNSMRAQAGISFAIPIDYVKEFLDKSKTKPQKVSKRYLGITMLTLTPEILMDLRMRTDEIPSDVQHGVLVFKVIIGSPAYNGGLQPGDIVTKINDKPMMSAKDVYTILESTAGSIKVELIRRNRYFTFVVTPESL